MIRIVRELKAVTGARTWQIEAVFVAAVLAAVAVASRKGAIEWLGVFAVFFTWMHASVADRMAEQHAAAVGGVECHRWAGRYYWCKELLWFGYFAWIGAWSALAGCALFLVWPLWRKAWRAQPKQRQRRHAREIELPTSEPDYIEVPFVPRPPYRCHCGGHCDFAPPRLCPRCLVEGKPCNFLGAYLSANVSFSRSRYRRDEIRAGVGTEICDVCWLNEDLEKWGGR